jgi:putative phage-type endonuclease
MSFFTEKKKIIINVYSYPKFNITCKRKIGSKYEPIAEQWVHDKQTDDEIDNSVKKRIRILENIMSKPEAKVKQKSLEWLELRKDKESASDCGAIVGLDHYKEQYEFLLSKLGKSKFESNQYCYHGNKYEEIANMLYSYRMNVQVLEVGFVNHKSCKFIGISPDGIVGKYKLDGKTLTKYAGRMIEIKCPPKRKIKLEGEIKGDIVPINYWAQVQMQLECCDLDECDFWQCAIEEYESREDFINDTDKTEPFRSITTGLEKGCLIQILPKKRILDEEYDQAVYDSAKFIHPPKIEQSPVECDIWIAQVLSDPIISDYCFDKIIYWKLVRSKCVTIKRDKTWFKENFVLLEKMWNYVEFFRENQDKKNILFDYIEHLEEKNNDEIMKLVDFLCNIPQDKIKLREYNNKIKNIIKEISEQEQKQK